MNILLITGGDSSERVISLKSAKQVKKALAGNGYKVYVYDVKKGYAPLKKLVRKFDVIFPVLHGEEGEGGGLHKFLSSFKTPIVGSRNWRAFKKAWYKISFKKFCVRNNISTAPWKIVKSEKDIARFGFPSVLKGSSGGSSKEVVILTSKKDLQKYSSKKIVNSRLPIFVERFLNGVEVTVGVLNNKAFPILEIVPPEGQWFDYKNKYLPTTKELVNAPSLSELTRKEVQKIALSIHKKLDLGSYSRLDFIVSGRDIYVLEVNTIPGLTENSLLPKAASAAGINFKKFVKILVESAK